VLSEEKLKSKILRIYENYDVDIEDITEEEMLRLINYYKDRPKILTKDLKKSKEYGEKNGQ